ncbi:hypothetical protein [Micromonospora sp. BRA006-A]|nr:hypothetical protein [Micromonospora sp. BRA006-A]MEE3921103.1 hypothetical protein [Micromonospora sp. BRA006-A]
MAATRAPVHLHRSLTGAVDRAAIFARALAPDEVADWQSRAFG